MEQLMKEIRAYAASRGIKPATVLQIAGGLGGMVWAKWEAGSATCTLSMADRLRAYMAANPPAAPAPVAPGRPDATGSVAPLPDLKDSAA
jgi:hypothetical protein